MRQIRFRVTGRVQGVGFRWATRQTADELGVLGWVENQADGAVRGVARAAPEVLGRFVSFLESGPPGARVEACEIEDDADATESEVDASRFRVRR